MTTHAARVTLPSVFTRFTIVTLSVALCVSATAAPSAYAATPTETAKKLHEQAKRAYRKNDKAQATELWREALRADPNWKYAYNLSNAAYETQHLLDAWKAVNEADRLGVPQPYQLQLSELRAKIRTGLLKDHARVTLTVTPKDAVVRRDGEVWSAPYTLWTTAVSSRIEVTREGYNPSAFVWHHDHKEHKRSVTLAKPTTGKLTVRGTPPEASVAIDGRIVGALPRVGPLPVAPGEHTITATLKGFVSVTSRVTVELGKGHTVDINLQPVPVLRPAPVKPPPADLATPGWVLLGAGVAAAAGGGGLLAWSGSTADEMRTLNGDAKALGAFPDFQAYGRAYSDLGRRFDSTNGAGIGLVVVGIASAIAGVVLVALDEGDGEDASKPTSSGASAPSVSINVGSTGASASTRWRF